VAACFLGLPADSRPKGIHFEICSTLDELAATALRLVGGRSENGSTGTDRIVDDEAQRMAPSQKFVRGLFAGGTFCYQSQQIFRDGGILVHSNAPLEGMLGLPDATPSSGHALIDMGADEFTIGTPHPMIDARQRVRHIDAQGKDATVAVLLLDVILGYNAASDPAGDLAHAISAAKKNASRAGRYLSVVASICGTDGDPQGLDRQERILQESGAAVFPSNVQAAGFARDIILRRLRG